MEACKNSWASDVHFKTTVYRSVTCCTTVFGVKKTLMYEYYSNLLHCEYNMKISEAIPYE